MKNADGRANNEFNRQQHDEKEKRLMKVYEKMLNAEGGMSVKEIAIEFNLSSNLARRYVVELVERKMIRLDRKDGKAPIYVAVKVGEEETVSSEPKAEALEVKPDGKEFEPGSYIPCSNVCKPGDVVWISSRSGEGQFFRYLIITPWERKAMVLGIMLEGHPQLNLNDPYYVYIGNDPETQKAMYADIRNNCQRGYKQFGERLIHVDKDLFDDVKARLARSMGFEPCKDKSVIIERLRKASDKQKETMAKLREENESLKRDLKNSYIHQDEYKKAADDATELNRKMSTDLQQEHEHYTKLYREYTVISEMADELKKSNAELEKKLEEAQSKPQVVDSEIVTGMLIDSEVKKTKIEVYEDEINMLRQMVFNMIKRGACQ